MNEQIKKGADIHAGDGGYSIGTQERYEQFVKERNRVVNGRIKELSEQAEKYTDDNFKGEPVWSEVYDQKFAELVRADEREACAKVCEKMEWDYWHSAEDQNNFTPIDCANAIRARGETK
jgi:hypothetical protein